MGMRQCTDGGRMVMSPMAEALKMKEILSNFDFMVGLALAFVKLFEFMLTAHQKDWLSDRALIFWNWLANQRKGMSWPCLKGDQDETP
jgi:hypothetical protein